MKKACILIHGLTGSPASLAPLTETLSKNGFRVITPLLAGHGTTKEDLADKKWQDWYISVEKAYNSVADFDEVYCAGLSLGSLLTMKLAAEKPIKKIVLMSTPLKFSPILTKILIPFTHLPIVGRFLRMSKKDYEKSVKDIAGREIYMQSSYQRIPLCAVWELQKLQEEVLHQVNKISQPVLIIHSKNDMASPPFNVKFLSEKLIQSKPSVLWLEKSEHIVTLDLEKETVCNSILEFWK